MSRDEALESDPASTGSSPSSRPPGALPAPPATSGSSTSALTPGQRLAEQRARKAREKTDARGLGQEHAAQAVVARASEAQHWLWDRRRVLVPALLGVMVVVGGITAWMMHRARTQHQSTVLLEEALEAMWPDKGANERGEGDANAAETPKPAEDESAAALETRAKAALNKYDALLKKYPRSRAAAWAQLGRGEALAVLNSESKAREAFRAALDAADNDDVTLAHRAIEGLAFSLERDKKFDEALAALKQLDRYQSEDKAILALQNYHLGRLYHLKGDDELAKKNLKAALRAFRDARAADVTRSGDSTRSWVFTEEQARLQLADIDPSAVNELDEKTAK